MTYAIEQIAATLREAREKKGLSQRALSALSGIPQSQISKIEKGAVDLRLSSLVALARALDVELTLVPRTMVPAVQSIVRTGAPGTSPDPDVARKVQNELVRLQNSINHLPRNALSQEVLDKYRRILRELQHFQLPQTELAKLRDTVRALNGSPNKDQNLRTLQDSLERLQQLRNRLLHRKVAEPQPPRPAYSLDEDDDA